ncbi:MAG: DUF4382 domain-containing protein [Deltaproteobacteria bacterium]|nr:DUF4382 domain-containing protein [Deltaproteobacteria bacterium]
MFKPTFFIALAAGSLAVSACDDQEAGVGRVELAMSHEPADAPIEGIHSAGIVISEVYLQGDAGRVVLRDTPINVNLLTLGTDIATIVDARVPDGTYGELRFVIDGAWVTVDGETGFETYASPGMEAIVDGELAGQLKLPSWGASGLKVKLPDDRLVVDGSHEILSVDFDVAESFRTQTGNGDWVMSPVVHALDIELTTAVEVHVTFAADLNVDGPLYVELRDRDGFVEGTVVLTDPDGDGIWTASFELLDPAEGPFTAVVIDADGAAVLTSPGTPTIAGESGLSVDIALVVVAID